MSKGDRIGFALLTTMFFLIFSTFGAFLVALAGELTGASDLFNKIPNTNYGFVLSGWFNGVLSAFFGMTLVRAVMSSPHKPKDRTTPPPPSPPPPRRKKLPRPTNVIPFRRAG